MPRASYDFARVVASLSAVGTLDAVATINHVATIDGANVIRASGDPDRP